MRHACKWAELLNTSRHVRAHDARYIHSYIYSQVTIIKFIVQKCIVVSLLRKSAFKLVVIGLITNIHMKNSVGVKIVKTIEP